MKCAAITGSLLLIPSTSYNLSNQSVTRVRIPSSGEESAALLEAASESSLAVQRRAIRFIGDPAVTYHLQSLSCQGAIDELSLFYRYSNEFCSSELTSVIA
nr:unnamed protein product [Callosobruchus chinensis]